MDWKQTLAKLAPTIATALGGPLAGMAVGIATKAIGVDGGEDALEEAIASGNPDVYLKLKEADSTLKVELKKLDISLEEIHAGDRSSARDMATKTTLAPQIILAVVFIAGFVAVLYSVFSGGAELTDTMKGVAMFLLGILSAGIGQIMNFFFGSSSGSKEKTQALVVKK